MVKRPTRKTSVRAEKKAALDFWNTVKDVNKAFELAKSYPSRTSINHLQTTLFEYARKLPNDDRAQGVVLSCLGVDLNLSAKYINSGKTLREIGINPSRLWEQLCELEFDDDDRVLAEFDAVEFEPDDTIDQAIEKVSQALTNAQTAQE